MDEFISVSFLISKVKDNHRNSCEVMAFKKLIGYVVFELKSKIFFKKRGNQFNKIASFDWVLIIAFKPFQ
jgi:hypothetical protein